MIRYDVFVSYNKADRRWARALVNRLKSSGLRPFFDLEIGLAGAALSSAIAEAIGDSRCVLILLTPDSVRSGWVGKEKQTALAFDPDARKRFVIPVLVKSCSIPADLSSIGHIDCREGLVDSKYREILASVRQRGIVELAGDRRPTDQWRFSLTPVATHLTDIAFVRQFEGWAVGNDGTILSTSDGGRSWQPHDVATKAPLSGLAFSKDGLNGWVCGQRGVLMQTSNGGASWARRQTGVEADLNSVAVCGHGTAICIVGREGIVLRGPAQRGVLKRIGLRSLDNLWQVQFSSGGYLGCIAGSHGTVFLSQDGGTSWRYCDVPVRAPLYGALVMNDHRTLWVVGEEGCVLVSTNRGKAWARRTVRGLGGGYDDWLNACGFAPDGRVGWAVGAQGLALNTADGGRTWSTFRFRESVELTNIRYQPDGRGWIVGSNGVVLTNRD